MENVAFLESDRPGETIGAAVQRVVAEDKIERYERFLRALVDDGARSPVFASLAQGDALDWIEEQARNLLDGCGAECPNCCTPLHDGACVSEAEDEDASPECEACGDRRGQCSHSS